MPFTVRVRAAFESAHHLISYRGQPEAVHGHSWQVEAAFAAGALDAESMAVDFVVAQAAVRELAAELDHRDLNTLPPFASANPTAERIAMWFFDNLARRPALASGPGRLAEVTVWEAPGCSVTYRPE